LCGTDTGGKEKQRLAPAHVILFTLISISFGKKNIVFIIGFGRLS
jgi:hypothetical protein